MLHSSESAADLRAAVLEALDSGADLRWANLIEANLSGADLRWADLSGTKYAPAYVCPHCGVHVDPRHHTLTECAAQRDKE